jgi:hypothetical protein
VLGAHTSSNPRLPWRRMEEPPSPPNGAAAWRPALPTTLIVVSMVVALVAVTALLYLLYTRTTGPGQVLRDFIEQVEAGDCEGSYERLDPSLQIDPETWCERLSELGEQVDARFAVRRVVLEENVAVVSVRNPDGTEAVWRLRRDGRSWRVLEPVTGVEL